MGSDSAVYFLLFFSHVNSGSTTYHWGPEARSFILSYSFYRHKIDILVVLQW